MVKVLPHTVYFSERLLYAFVMGTMRILQIFR